MFNKSLSLKALEKSGKTTQAFLLNTCMVIIQSIHVKTIETVFKTFSAVYIYISLNQCC